MRTGRAVHETEARQGEIRREPGCAAVDASDLGLHPGEFPKHLRIVCDGIASNWYKVGPKMEDGELAFVIYTANVLSSTGRTLKVFNN